MFIFDLNLLLEGKYHWAMATSGRCLDGAVELIRDFWSEVDRQREIQQLHHFSTHLDTNLVNGIIVFQALNSIFSPCINALRVNHHLEI
jgi:hypothetical protein